MSGGFLRGIRDRLWPMSRHAARPGPAALPDGVRVYAIGDIHGEAALLDDLMRRIAADLSATPAEQARAILIGDYIDRGPDSRSVIERLIKADLPLAFEALRGNHEDLLLRAIADPAVMPQWCSAGGTATLRSYGVDAGKIARRGAMTRLHEAFVDALPPSHLAFLRSTKLSRSIGDYFFVHAGARPGIPLERQDARDLMWIRDECYASAFDFGKVLVHGHTPRKRPENLARRINVDTGAFKWGVLTAAVLEGRTRRFMSTRD